MKTFAILASGIMLTALMAPAGAAQAATFVYVSNAEDGDIGIYTLRSHNIRVVRYESPLKSPVELSSQGRALDRTGSVIQG